MLPALVHAEPEPATVIVPAEPARLPRKPPAGPVSTFPPLEIVTCPVPEWPMASPALFVQVAPTPLTVTVPTPPAIQASQPPTRPTALLTVPPLPMLRAPVPLVPT